MVERPQLLSWSYSKVIDRAIGKAKVKNGMQQKFELAVV
jgi:hypothetical protein